MYAGPKYARLGCTHCRYLHGSSYEKSYINTVFCVTYGSKYTHVHIAQRLPFPQKMILPRKTFSSTFIPIDFRFLKNVDHF